MNLKKMLEWFLVTGLGIFHMEIFAIIVLVISTLTFGIFGENAESEASPKPESIQSRNYE